MWSAIGVGYIDVFVDVMSLSGIRVLSNGRGKEEECIRQHRVIRQRKYRPELMSENRDAEGRGLIGQADCEKVGTESHRRRKDDDVRML